MGNFFKGIRIKYLNSNFLKKKKRSITENWCMFFTYRGEGRQRCCPSLACNGEELDAAQCIHVVSVPALGSANTFIQNCGSRKTVRILKHYCSSFQSHWSEYYNGRKKGTDAEGEGQMAHLRCQAHSMAFRVAEPRTDTHYCSAAAKQQEQSIFSLYQTFSDLAEHLFEFDGRGYNVCSF